MWNHALYNTWRYLNDTVQIFLTHFRTPCWSLHECLSDVLIYPAAWSVFQARGRFTVCSFRNSCSNVFADHRLKNISLARPILIKNMSFYRSLSDLYTQKFSFLCRTDTGFHGVWFLLELQTVIKWYKRNESDTRTLCGVLEMSAEMDTVLTVTTTRRRDVEMELYACSDLT
jgi:hypothetical protein